MLSWSLALYGRPFCWCSSTEHQRRELRMRGLRAACEPVWVIHCLAKPVCIATHADRHPALRACGRGGGC